MVSTRAATASWKSTWLNLEGALPARSGQCLSGHRGSQLGPCRSVMGSRSAVDLLPCAGPLPRDGPDGSLHRKLNLLVAAAARSLSSRSPLTLGHDLFAYMYTVQGGAAAETRACAGPGQARGAGCCFRPEARGARRSFRAGAPPNEPGGLLDLGGGALPRGRGTSCGRRLLPVRVDGIVRRCAAFSALTYAVAERGSDGSAGRGWQGRGGSTTPATRAPRQRPRVKSATRDPRPRATRPPGLARIFVKFLARPGHSSEF